MPPVGIGAVRPKAIVVWSPVGTDSGLNYRAVRSTRAEVRCGLCHHHAVKASFGAFIVSILGWAFPGRRQRGGRNKATHMHPTQQPSSAGPILFSTENWTKGMSSRSGNKLNMSQEGEKASSRCGERPSQEGVGG